MDRREMKAPDRPRAVVLLRTAAMLCLLLAAQAAQALGLGDLSVRSYLGQPLAARIELLSNSPGELEGVSAALASADSFRLVGLDRLALSVPLEFTVSKETTAAFIEVRSRDVVNEPVVQFVVEVNFANGRLLRQYTLFLDPPAVSAPVPLPALSRRESEPPAKPQGEAPAAAVSREPLAQAVEPAQAVPEPAALPVTEPETGDDAGFKAESSEPVTQEPEAAPEELVEAPPEAELVSDEPPGEAPMEEDTGVAAEATEEVPAPEPEQAAVSEAEPAPEELGDRPSAAEEPADGEESLDRVAAEPARPAPVTPRYQASIEDLETYGPVQAGQTLWSIASAAAAGTGSSVNQMMLAIQRYNPEAFAQNNINLLKRGSVLRLPPASELERLNAMQAMLEAMRQAEEYTDILAGRTPEPMPAPALADTGPAKADVVAQAPLRSDDAEGRLELVPPELPLDQEAPGTGEGIESAGPAGSGTSEDGLLTEEERDSAAQESEYLSERMQELQQQLDDDGTAIEVADEGLAEMERSLREQRTSGEPPAPLVVAPPREDSPWYRVVGWWLVAPLLLIGLVALILRRRSVAAETGLELTSPAATARAIASEAEEILRVLDDGESRSVGPGDPVVGADSEVDEEASVIDFESYIEHGGEEEHFVTEDSGQRQPGMAEDGEAARPEADEDRPFWEAAPGSRADPGPTVPGEPHGGHPPGADEEAIELDASDPETKLDLARAYIAMGDKTAARELLEEVIAIGNDAQVDEARSMMEEI